MDIVSTDPSRPGIFAFGQVAVGVIAFGQSALGVIAVGQIARGVFCLGQGAIGVFCIGQGSIGLWHGSGMVGLAGQRGYGLVLHLLPRLVRDHPPELPPTTPLHALLRGEVKEGWIGARLVDDRGEPNVVVDGGVRVDATAVRGSLLEGIARGADRVHLYVRIDVVVDDARYRVTETHTDLVGVRAVVYTSRPPVRLAYGVPPKGAVGAGASTIAIVWRTGLWLAAAAVVGVIALWPAFAAIFGLTAPF